MLDELFFVLGNAVLFIGTLLMIKEVIKDRKILTGVSTIGAVLTLFAIGLFQMAYLVSHQDISLLLGAVTFLYWLFVVIFKLIYGD